MDSQTQKQQKRQPRTNQRTNDGNKARGNFQKDRQHQQPRRPRIQIRTPIEEIKLNDIQAEKIKELNDKLHEIGEAVAPSEREHNAKLDSIEKRFNQAKGNIETYRHMIDEEHGKRDAYIKKNSGIAPNTITEIQTSLNELNQKKSQIEAEIKEANDKHTKLQSQLRDIRSKSGMKSRDEARAKIAQIDNRIEVETLTNAQLKKLMSERDRILAAEKDLGGVDKLIQDDDDSRKRVNQLFDEKKKIQSQINDLLHKRTETRTQLDSLREETKKFNDQAQVYYDKIKELRSELNKISAERDAEYNSYRNALNAYRKKLNQITDLHYERDVIYREAERTMLQILEGQRKIGEIQERVNPHQKEIAAAKSLITYLEGLQDAGKEQQRQQKTAQHTKGSNKQAEALIASLKKGAKGKQQRQQKKNAKAGIVHSMDAMAQFAIVDVAAPSNMSQVAAALEELRAKAKEWESEFVKAIVNFNISEDGKVTVEVKLA